MKESAGWNAQMFCNYRLCQQRLLLLSKLHYVAFRQTTFWVINHAPHRSDRYDIILFARHMQILFVFCSGVVPPPLMLPNSAMSLVDRANLVEN